MIGETSCLLGVSALRPGDAVAYAPEPVALQDAPAPLPRLEEPPVEHPRLRVVRPQRGGHESRRRYVPGLDGLRALGVLAVLAYHLGIGWAPGGFVGVDVFFVLSGYLITDLLVRERLGAGWINLRHFWVRRARRLFPALAVMLLVVIAVTTIVDRVALRQLRGDVAAAATYTSNWWQIAQHDSYFAQFAQPSLLQHLWSLAIEEQFYLLWPLVVAAGLRWLPRHRFAALALMCGVASALVMGVLYRPYDDPSRLYFGSDTHAVGLFVGAAMAFVWPVLRPAPGLTPAGRRVLDLAGLAALGGIAAGIAMLNEIGPSTYRGGLVGVVLASAVLTAAVVHPSTWIGRAFGVGPLRWIGRRSYAIYLWHWPVIVLARETLGPHTTSGWRAHASLTAVSIALAALSWRFVEQPAQREGIGRGSVALLQRIGQGLAHRRPVGLVGATVLAAVTVVAATGLVMPGREAGPAAQIEAGERLAAKPDPVVVPTHTNDAPARSEPDKPKQQQPDPTPTPKPEPKPLPAGSDTVAIGDSVLLAAATALTDQLPGIRIEAAVGQQMWQAPSVVAKLNADGRLRHTVLIALGTNGQVTERDLGRLYDVIGPGHRIVLVTVWVPRDWQDPSNEAIAAQRDRDNVTIVDWHAEAAAHPELLWDDDVHPTETGAKRYAELIATALRQQ